MSATVEIPPAGSYTIDPERSRVTFSGRHLLGLPVRGGFGLIGGSIQVADPVTGSRAEAEIDATSFDTGNRQRDVEIRSRRYLDIERYPVISFTAEGVREDGKRWVLDGSLTVLEVTRPVVLEIERAAITGGTFVARATTRVDRTDFGVDSLSALGGRDLALIIDVTAIPD